MTDNEIIKAKEHFKYGISHDIFKEPVLSYAKTVLWAFEEINRQKAEIERLKQQYKLLESNSLIFKGGVDYFIAEAIKEFAEKLKTKVNIDLCEAINCSDYLYDFPKLVDNLVKEITQKEGAKK